MANENIKLLRVVDDEGKTLQQLQGIDAIGCGYQTVTGQFANIDSCVGQLFDFDKIGYKEFTTAATGKIYGIPKKFVQYLDKNKRESETVSGETVEDFVNKLSASVEIGAKYAGFEGSVKSEFSETSSYSRYNSYTRLQFNTSFWRLTLEETTGNARNFLKEFVREQIDSLEPIELYRKFGTHYVNDITVGGRCVTSAVTNRLKSGNQTSFGELLTAKFEEGVFGASASSNVTNEKDLQKFNENSTFKTKITGGDVAVYGSDSKPNLEEWALTVQEHPMMIDFGSRRGLVPIWELAKTEERKKVLKDKMDEYFEARRSGFKLEKGPVLEGRWVVGRRQLISGTGVCVYEPELCEGWFILGQQCYQDDYDPNRLSRALAVRPKAWAKGIFSPIKSYAAALNSNSSGTKGLFRPVPGEPMDFVSLGHFCHNGSPPENANSVIAIHREFVVQASIGKTVANLAGIGSCWKIEVPEEGLPDCDYWVGGGSSPPSSTDAFCLNKSAIEIIGPIEN